MHTSFLQCTVHFVNHNWELKSFCLETVLLFDDHTGVNIHESIADIMTNWQLSTDKLVVTTTDNGSNVVAAFDFLWFSKIELLWSLFGLGHPKVFR